MGFRVDFAPQALRDLSDIADYIKKRGSLESAERWFNGIFADIHSLDETPARCRVANASAEAGMEIRLLLHGRRNRQYKVYFTIDARQKTVHVLHVRHWARRPLSGEEWAEKLREDLND